MCIKRGKRKKEKGERGRERKKERWERERGRENKAVGAKAMALRLFEPLIHLKSI